MIFDLKEWLCLENYKKIRNNVVNFWYEILSNLKTLSFFLSFGKNLTVWSEYWHHCWHTFNYGKKTTKRSDPHMPCAARVRKEESSVNGWEEVCLLPPSIYEIHGSAFTSTYPSPIRLPWLEKKNTQKTHTKTVIPKCLVPQGIERIRHRPLRGVGWGAFPTGYAFPPVFQIHVNKFRRARSPSPVVG